jgi:hypothetical protein
MPVDNYDEIKFSEINKEKVKEFLLSKDFEEMTIDRSLKGIKKVKTLDKFF